MLDLSRSWEKFGGVIHEGARYSSIPHTPFCIVAYFIHVVCTLFRFPAKGVRIGLSVSAPVRPRNQ